MAYYYETVGQIHAAEQAYQQALMLMPKSGQVNNNYGAFLCGQGHYQQALVHFERAINDAYYHQTASVYENAALCCAKKGDFEAAAHYADLAVQQDPTRTAIYSKLNAVLEQQDDKKAALAKS